MTRQTGPVAGDYQMLFYYYDLAGRRTSMDYGQGLVVGYSYLLTGEVTEIRENPSGGNTLLGTYAYDNLGRRTSLTRGNGTTATYSYDAASRLSQLVENMNGTTHDMTLGFTYNPAAQITSNTRSNDTYAYTARVNLNVTDAINGLNQVTATGATSISYGDSRGNITAIGAASYGYTSENMLVTAPSSATLAYDPLVRLYQTVGGGTTTRFAYDGATMIAEYDGSNSLQRRFAHGPGVDEPIVWYEGTGTSDRRFLHADERGSIVAVSDGSGNVTNVNSYDEYGMPASSNVGRFGYTGQTWIAEAGLWYYRARMYNPSLGRFMQTDPIGYAGGMNLYAYVSGDPVNFRDPSGLCNGSIEIVNGEKVVEVCAPERDILVNMSVLLRGVSGDGGFGSDFGGAPISPILDDLQTVVEDLIESLNEQRQVILQRVREQVCQIAQSLPENGRLRFGADGDYGLGAAIIGGSGISLHRDLSLNFDAYYGIGGGVGYAAGGGFSLDDGRRAGEGWRRTSMYASGVFGPATLSHSPSDGPGASLTILGGSAGAMGSVTGRESYTTQLTRPICRN